MASEIFTMTFTVTLAKDIVLVVVGAVSAFVSLRAFRASAKADRQRRTPQLHQLAHKVVAAFFSVSENYDDLRLAQRTWLIDYKRRFTEPDNIMTDSENRLRSTLCKMMGISACSRPLASGTAATHGEFPHARCQPGMLKNAQPPTDGSALLPERR